MDGRRALAILRRLCDDLDAGRTPRAPRLRRALVTLAAPVALGLAGPGLGGCPGGATGPAAAPEAAPLAVEATPPGAEAVAGGARADAGPADRPAEAEGPVTSAEGDGESVDAEPAPSGRRPSYGTGGGAPAGPPRIAVGPTVVAYGSPFPRDEIAGVVRRGMPEIRRCYEAARGGAEAPSEDRVVLLWGIAADGHVEAARVESSTLEDARADRCLVEAVSRMRFTPRYAGTGGTVQVRYPFVFRREPAE